MRYARLLVLGVFVSLVALGCSSEQQGGSAGQTTAEQGGTTAVEEPEETTAGDRPQTTGGQSGNQAQQQNPSQPGQGVRLRIGGEEGARFSGSCTIAGERRKIGGTVPESYNFKPGKGPVACNIRKQGPGDLRVVFASDGQRSVQTVSGQNAKLKLRYNNGGLSSRVQSATQKATQSANQNSQRAKQKAKQKVEQFSGGDY